MEKGSEERLRQAVAGLGEPCRDWNGGGMESKHGLPESADVMALQV